MFTSVLTLTSLLTTALAAPLAARDAAPAPPLSITTGMTSLRSGSPIHVAAINATNNNFWIGKPTTTYCAPLSGQNCDSFSNFTEVTVYTQKTEYQVFAAVNVPGGQNVYVAPDGALSFTTAHTEYSFPEGSYTNGFDYQTTENGVAFLNPSMGGATGWLACSATDAATQTTAWKIFADVVGFGDAATPSGKKSDCLGFSMLVATPDTPAPHGFPAYEYV